MIFSFITIALYLGGAVFKGMQVAHKMHSPKDALGKILIAVALVTHAISVYGVVVSSDGINLGFFKVSSLICLFMGFLAFTAILRDKPIDSLLVILFPLATISILLSEFMPTTSEPLDHLGGSLIVHILLSILAYSVLTIASMQAITLLIQERELKKHHTIGLIQWLPPLQTMEGLLFDMIWFGIVLLSGSIISGFVFFDDMFAQHLVHKTVFTLIAWLIFAILLWGRHYLGWRGRTAVKWTIGGFLALMLAYFGSKFVLELVLQKV